MDTRTNPHRLRTDQLREELQRLDVHALLVPSADPHLSEYLPERWQTRQWLSGFTGSMGTLVVTVDKAAVFADSRYWVQAEAELAGSGIELVKIPTGASALHIDWLAAQVPAGRTVAVDGQVLGLAAAQALKTALDRAGVLLRTDLDPVDAVWPERPAAPCGQARPGARSHGAPRRHAPFRLHGGRHRLDHQPARLGCLLQPRVPGPPADRRAAGHAVRG
jgi:Xaa-Pro aminopeptidase